MKSAIVRHILVKDKELAEQLKKKIKAGQILPNWPNSIPPALQVKKGVNWGILKKVNWSARLIKPYLPWQNVNCTARLKVNLVGIYWKLNSVWIKKFSAGFYRV